VLRNVARLRLGHLHLLVLTGIVLIKLASNPSAATEIECVDTLAGWLSDKNIEFVFDGTVVAEEGAWPGLVRSTVDVHRVWKGEVPRAMRGSIPSEVHRR
jgi:hypothetical protein